MSNNPTPPNMGAQSENKKSHRCLTCCIICLVIIALFVAALIGGSALAFNKFVSPSIGGVKFGSAVRLLGGLYNGNSKRSRAKILTDTYTEEDLSDFYDELNAHLFLKVRGVAELEAEYDALSDEDKEAVLTELKANAKWNYNYNQKKDADKAAFVKEYYVAAHRYPLTVAKILSVVDLNQLTGGDSESTQALADFVGTDPVARLAAAGEAEESTQTEDGAEATSGEGENDLNELLNTLIKDLEFDFKGGLLGDFDYTQSEDYAANIKSVNFEITGNEIAAVVGEVVSQALSLIDLGKTMGTESINIDLSEIYLPAYIAIPQVIIQHKEDLPDNPTEEQLAAYNKNTYVSATLQMEFKKLLSNKALQNAVKESMADMLPTPSLVNVAFGVVRSILPKVLFVTVGFYPLDPDAAAFVKINNYSEKSQKDLAKIINSVAGGNMFDSESVGTETADGEQTDMMQQLNARVVTLFQSLEEQGVPLTFIDAATEKNSKRVGLRLAHIQMLLNMMNAYDPTGENGITPYLFMTVLKCLFSDATMVPPTEGDLDALYTEIENKYGIQKTFWQGGGLLNMDNLQNIPSNINIADIELEDNATMRVNLQDKQLLSLFVRAKEDGKLDELFGTSDSGTAAAAEGESETQETNVNDIINSLNFSLMSITKVADADVYKLSIRATLSIVNILNSVIGEEESIIKTMSSALPNSMSFGISVYLHADADGKVTMVGADEAGNYATAFLVNAFDETYTQKVINTISTLMRCLNGGESSFDTSSLQEKIESAFNTIFDTLKDNLYVSIGVKDGALVLPSIYEVVHGFGQKKIESSDTLTDADNLTNEEIRGVLTTIYHSGYAPAAYTGNPGDAMLSDLQSKYYLAEAWTADDLFGGTVNVGDKINADSLRFRDTLDDGGNTVVGLYRDTRTLDQLRVNIAGDALADLIGKSGKLDSISSGGEGDMLKGLNVVNCTYTVQGGATYANFIFNARLTDTVAAAAEESTSTDFDINTLLPDNIYLTAGILMHKSDEDYTTTARYSTNLIVNGDQANTDNLFKLIKLFSGEEFDRSKVSNQVSDSVKDAFATIEESVNFAYGATPAQALQLDTVFNTINKLSNKPSEEQKNDPSYVPYQSDYADDLALMTQMREFGRDPLAQSEEVTLLDGVSTQTVVYDVDVDSYSDIFGIDAVEKAPTEDDQAAFFSTLNNNFYIVNEDKKLTVAKVNSGNLVVDDTYISLPALYQDTRQHSDLITYASDKQMASLIHAMYSAGLEVKNGEELIGTATIMAVHMTPTYMQVFIKVAMNSESSNAKLMPETLYLTTKTYLVDPDGEGEQAIYDTEVCINNLSVAETKDLFDRLNKLATSMSLNFTLNLNNVTDPVKENLQSVFDTKIKSLGNVQYLDGKMQIPSLFAYLADGKLVKDGGGNSTYDNTQYMVDIDISTEPDYYATHTAATDTNKTSAETLMYRMRELGKAQYTVDFANNMVVWQGGLPAASGAKYNTNTFTQADEDAFYDQLQAYYFFQGNEENRPNANWFKEGATNIFDKLTSDFASSFNLYGYTYYGQTNSFAGSLASYADAGLYNYDSTQYGAKMSDKAMASLMKTLGNDVLTIDASNISGISVTSVRIDWDSLNYNLTIEITVEVTVDTASASSLPEKFYMTTVTVRNSVDPANPVYNTKMTLNRFALDSTVGAGDGDLAKFLNNLAHIDTLNIKDQLDTDKICQNVTDALKKMLDDKLADYIVPFNDYEDDAEGYIEFYNIYHQIADKLDVNRTLFNNADQDIMHVIYKMHNVNGYINNCNESTGSEGISLTEITDRQFANIVKVSLNSTKSYVTGSKSIFFVDNNDSDLFADWQDIIRQAQFANNMQFADGNTYVLATVAINISGASVGTSVALLPETIYASVVIHIDGGLNEVVCTFLNDFTYNQTELIKSVVSNAGNLNVEDDIKTLIMSNLTGVTFESNYNNGFDGYVGQAIK